MKLMWTNKYSGETGYVKSLKVKAGCFENTYDLAEARNFRTQKDVDNALKSLTEMGEADNNNFSVVD